MFILPPEHETAFAGASLASFKRRAARHLRQHHSALRDVPEGDLRRRIDAGCEQAQTYGLTSELDLIRFLHASVILGDPLLPTSPFRSVVSWLRDRRIAPARRALGAWEEAKQVANAAPNRKEAVHG